MRGVFIKLIIIALIFHLTILGLTGCKRKSVSTPTNAKPKSIYEAAMLGDKSSLEYFLNQGSLVNSRDKMGSTPLHWAAAFGQLEVVKLLIDKGASVNTTNKMGDTPLGASTAGNRGFLDVAELLIEHGAEINVQDKNGSTALHDAVINGQPKMVEILLARGADPKIKNNNGQTPLDLVETLSRTQFRKGSPMYNRRNRFEECLKILQELQDK